MHPDIRTREAGRRTPEDSLEECVSLCAAIELDVVFSEVAPVAQMRPSTLFGSGKVESYAARLKAEEIEIVVINGALTPVQQRNLERAWKVKVLDRTALILEIFGERARTREGVLQVDLAHLVYQKSRLVRSWTHLERQRGSTSFVGGPGETQIESDRRALDERIIKLRRQLEKVVRTRELHRKAREKVPYPIVALVGYTNAGKSTLFNRLTSADVMAKDMLFATLDPTMRAIELPSGGRVILSDTVGFISDLPTQLVAAFRATLEEVMAAEVIVHVRDIAHPETEAQASDVRDVLADLGLGEAALEAVVEARNKVDLLGEEPRAREMAEAERKPRVAALSAETGFGVAALLTEISNALAEPRLNLTISLDHGEGAAMAWLYERGAVASRLDREGDVELVLDIPERQFRQFAKAFGKTDADVKLALEAGP